MHYILEAAINNVNILQTIATFKISVRLQYHWDSFTTYHIYIEYLEGKYKRWKANLICVSRRGLSLGRHVPYLLTKVCIVLPHVPAENIDSVVRN